MLLGSEDVADWLMIQRYKAVEEHAGGSAGVLNCNGSETGRTFHRQEDSCEERESIG